MPSVPPRHATCRKCPPPSEQPVALLTELCETDDARHRASASSAAPEPTALSLRPGARDPSSAEGRAGWDDTAAGGRGEGGREGGREVERVTRRSFALAQQLAGGYLLLSGSLPVRDLLYLAST